MGDTTAVLGSVGGICVYDLREGHGIMVFVA